MKGLISIALAVTLVGCASLPTPEQSASADYGSYPEDYESIVKDYYARVLKDPESVRYGAITTPRTFWLGNRIEGVRYGYMVCVTLNAKNSYGGYVGNRTNGLLIRNGRVIYVADDGKYVGRYVC